MSTTALDLDKVWDNFPVVISSRAKRGLAHIFNETNGFTKSSTIHFDSVTRPDTAEFGVVDPETEKDEMVTAEVFGALSVLPQILEKHGKTVYVKVLTDFTAPARGLVFIAPRRPTEYELRAIQEAKQFRFDLRSTLELEKA